MRYFLTALTILILLLAGGIFFVALPHAEKKIELALQDMGFNGASVEHSAFNPTGLIVEKIYLDTEKLSVIQNMKINIFWPTFLAHRNIDAIYIENFKLLGTPENLRRRLISLNDIEKISQYNVPHIVIERVEISTIISNQSYFLDGALSISQDGDIKMVGINLRANQPQLSFKTIWSGKINQTNKKIFLDGIFDDIHIQTKPLTVNRGTGWVSYILENNTPSFNAQFDAGSGSIFSVAANALSLVIGQDEDKYPVMFRADAAAAPNVRLSSDLTYHSDVAQRDFTASLDIPSTAGFMDYLSQQNLISNDIQTQIETLHVNIEYQEDKRFAGGPLPFDITIEDKDTDKLNGTFLIYPDSFDVRGTTETQEDMLSLLKNIFTIPEENISDNVIRLESNIQSLLK